MLWDLFLLFTVDSVCWILRLEPSKICCIATASNTTVFGLYSFIPFLQYVLLNGSYAFCTLTSAEFLFTLALNFLIQMFNYLPVC